MPAEQPRVLVVTSNNFNDVSGGGITLSNLFRGWPQERLANLHEDDTPETRTVCQQSYRLSAREVRRIWPFSWLDRTGDTRAATSSTLSPAAAGSMQGRLRAIVGDGIPRTVRISPELQAWIGRFEPEVIYAFLGSMVQLQLVKLLRASTGAPLVIHTMDDWPRVIYRKGIFAPVARRAVLQTWNELLAAAAGRLVISDAMAREFQHRYGYPFLPFHNALELDGWLAHQRRDWRAGEPFVIAYAGSILPAAQAAAMATLVDVVRQLAAAGGPIVLRIYAPAGQADRFTHESDRVIQRFDPPGSENIARVLASADLLVLPFNFDESSREYIRLSMPTKVPAYMASGTPALLFGPPDVAAVEYARQEQWGLVVDRDDRAALGRAIETVRNDSALRMQLGKRGIAVAEARHDARRVRAAFWAVLAGAAQSSAVGAA